MTKGLEWICLKSFMRTICMSWLEVWLAEHIFQRIFYFSVVISDVDERGTERLTWVLIEGPRVLAQEILACLFDSPVRYQPVFIDRLTRDWAGEVILFIKVIIFLSKLNCCRSLVIEVALDNGKLISLSARDHGWLPHNHS